MMSAKGKPTPKKGILKSKFKERGKSSSSKLKHETPESFKDSVLTYPFIKISDNERTIPRYSAVLRRSEDEGVGMDDLDTLQLELESLLSAVAVRTRALQDEVQSLTSAEDRHDKRKVSFQLPGKRIKSQEKIVKKPKDTTGKVIGDSFPSSTSNKVVKLKTMPSGVRNTGIAETDIPDALSQEAPKVVMPKNNTPNRFWTFIEPYCAEVTSEDVKLLESLIEENSNDSEYYEVPSQGRHYTVRWADEDTLGDKNIKNEFSTKKIEKSNEGIAAGPLTQRLFSALMEETLVHGDIICKGDENRIPQLFKSFTVNNSANFERQIRKELEEQGILDIDEMVRDEESDEILQELKRCQAELKLTSAHNVQHLKRLIKLANEELARQDLKKKLQKADNEVMKIHQKLLAAKRKKEIFSKKEQELCWKTLKDRDMLLRLIDSL